MWRVSSFMFFYRAFGDASHETWMLGDTPLHFFQMRGVPHPDVKARHPIPRAGEATLITGSAGEWRTKK